MARAAIRNLRQRFKVASYSAEFQKHLQHITDMRCSRPDRVLHLRLAEPPGHGGGSRCTEDLEKAMESAQRIELMLASRSRTGVHPSGVLAPLLLLVVVTALVRVV